MKTSMLRWLKNKLLFRNLRQGKRRRKATSRAALAANFSVENLEDRQMLAFSALGDDFAISDAGGFGNAAFEAFDPAVAYNSRDNRYLVVWAADDPDGGTGVVDGELEIFGQVIDATTGAVIKDDFRISFAGGSGKTATTAHQPDVAYNSVDNEFFVVWSTDNPLGQADDEFEIWGMRLTGSGDYIGNGANSRISGIGGSNNAEFDAFNPKVAYNSTDNQYLVVWEADDPDIAGIVNDEFEIFGEVLTADLNFVNFDIRISDAGGTGNAAIDARNPDVVYNPTQNQYLVVWEADDTDASVSSGQSAVVDESYEIFGQILTSAGIEAGTNDFRISDVDVVNSSWDEETDFDAFEPAVEFNSTRNEYMVVWRANDGNRFTVYEVFGQRLNASGSQIGSNDFRISDVFGRNGPGNFDADAVRPDVAYNPQDQEFLVTWEGSPFSFLQFDIWGHRLSATGSLIGSSAFSISNVNGYARDVAVTYASGSEQYLVIWEGENPTPTAPGEDEIFGQRYGKPAEVTINDVTGNEGTGTGTANLIFTVTASTNSTSFSVDYKTVFASAGDGSFLTENDFLARSGKVNFTAGGPLKQTFSVPVNRDSVPEFDEQFTVLLSNPQGAVTIVDAVGTATILNDDAGDIPVGSISNLGGKTGGDSIDDFTVPSGFNRMLVVATRGASASFNGIPMTKIAQGAKDLATARIYVLKLGSGQAITGRIDAGGGWVVANVFGNVSQTTPVDDTDSLTSTSNGLKTLTLDSETGDLLFDAIMHNPVPNGTLSADSSQTVLVNRTVGFGNVFAGTSMKRGAAPDTSMSWTVSTISQFTNIVPFIGYAAININHDRPPEFTSSGPFVIPKFVPVGFVAADLDGNDGEGGANDTNVTYRLLGGFEADAFAIDPATGIITVTNPALIGAPLTPQYENVLVEISDGTRTTTQTIQILVNAPPSIENQSLSSPENSTMVGQVMAVDLYFDDIVTYEILSNSLHPGDESFFSIDNSGNLTFVAPPDFETPLDADGDNSYVFDVKVTDSLSQTDTATVTVNVTDIVGAPVVVAPGTFTTASGNLTLIRNGSNAELRITGTTTVLQSFEVDDEDIGSVDLIGRDNVSDTLTIDFSGGNPLPADGANFAGGVGGNDKLVVLGTPSQSANYTPDTSTTGNGKIDVSDVSGTRTITFTGLEPVDISGMAAATLSLPLAGVNDTLTVAEGFDFATGTIPALRINGTTGDSAQGAGDGTPIEAVALANNGEVIIDTTVGDGDDVINITSGDNAHGNDSLTIGTGTGNDIVHFQGDFAPDGGNVTVDTGTIHVGAVITAAGSGAIDLEAGRRITIASNGTIESDQGNITLSANTAATSTGTFAGIEVNGGIIQTNDGTVSLTAIGGDAGASPGIAIYGGSLIDSRVAGNIQINGTAAPSSSASGIEISGPGTRVVSHYGTILLESPDSAGSGSDVEITSQASIESTNSTVTIEAGDDFLLADTASLAAAGAITIGSDFGDADSSVGGVIELSGHIIAATLLASGGGDDDILRFTGMTAGQLDFSGDLDGVGNGHTNSAFTASGLATQNIGLHFDGAAGADQIEMSLTDPLDISYFADDDTAANSGVVNVSGEFTLSFTGLDPLVLKGTGGTLLVDASALPALTAMTVEDDNTDIAGTGGNVIKGDGGLETTYFSGFSNAVVRSGDGDETITLMNLDVSAATNGIALQSITLDGDNISDTDVAKDTIKVQSLPAMNGVGAPVTSDLRGGAGDDTFNIGGTGNDLSVIEGNVTILGEGGNDRLPLNISSLPTAGNRIIAYDGGAGNDEVDLTGTATQVTHSFASLGAGIVDIDGYVISYTEVEPIADEVVAANRLFEFRGGAETITVSDDATGADNQSRIDSTQGTVVEFVHPTVTVTIQTESNGGSGSDSIIVRGVDSLFDVDLAIYAGQGDALQFQDRPTDIGTGELTAEVEDILVQNAVSSEADITLTAADEITFGTNGSLYTEAILSLNSSRAVSLGDLSGDEIRVAVSNDASINTGANLALLENSFAPVFGDTITIIDNQGVDPIDGEFSNLPDGLFLLLNGTYFEVDYQGGDGNDLTLVGNVITSFGSDADDTVFVDLVSGNYVLTASYLSSPQLFPANLAESVAIFTNAGNDTVEISDSIEITARLFGGDGDDTLLGGSGDDIVTGGDGIDVLQARGGRNVLIGGLGADEFTGDKKRQGDLIIAGRSIHENDLNCLDLVLQEWTSARTIQEITENLFSATGPVLDGSDVRLIAGTTVFDDGQRDQMFKFGGRIEDFIFADIDELDDDDDILPRQKFDHIVDLKEFLIP